MFGKDKEKYNTSKDKSPDSFHNEGDIDYTFEISGILKNGEIIFDYAKYIVLNPLTHGNYIISFTLIIISIIALIGMFIERYLFFIESKHTVSLFYGNKTI